MNIKVQRQKPSRGEGAQGEMRLVMMARGSWLYIKGGNQWHSLSLVPSETRGQIERRMRGNLERYIREVDDENADGTLPMKFDYDLLQVPKGLKDVKIDKNFTNYIGDILVEILEKQIKDGKISDSLK